MIYFTTKKNVGELERSMETSLIAEDLHKRWMSEDYLFMRADLVKDTKGSGTSVL
jgi:hypothetical protein